MSDPRTVRRSTGSAPAAAGGVLRIVEHHLVWYRRNWRATAVSSVLAPLLFLLAFGVGFGTLVAGAADGDRLAAATGGVGYLVWLAPALLAVAAVQTATFESTYPVLSGFRWQRVYHAMVAGPVSPGQVAVAHLAFVSAKIAGTGLVYVAVIVAFGGVVGPGILGSLLAAVLTGAAVAAAVTAYSARLESEGSAFSLLFRLVLIPMTLFSGTFFPVDRLPGWVQPVVWASPLWHGTELARAAALGTGAPGALLVHVGVLVALLAAGGRLAVLAYRRRLLR